MKENQSLEFVESSTGKNEYCVVRRKKKTSILNLLLLQVGICLIVSVGVLVFRAVAGENTVTATVNNFIGFVTV